MSNDFEGPHHIVVFMLQHVAVNDLAAGVALEAGDDGEHVSGVDDGGVLPPGFAGLRRARRSFHLQLAAAKRQGVESLAMQYLKLYQVHMHGMSVFRGIDEAPFLNRA